MEVKKVLFKHILYATDFSENAKNACSYAKSIANQYGAEITLLHVIKDELPEFMVFDAGNERSPIGVTNRLAMQKEYFEDKREEIISKISAEYNVKGIEIKDIIVERGNPVKMIAQIAEQKECDLIVMGVKGKSSFEDFLIGDTARRVISRSKLPVLVVQNENK